MRVLISGASIAGPTLAYWLQRWGHQPTVVERAPTLRKTGGHAVDLFEPAMEIMERMGVVDAVRARTTGTDWITMYLAGARRPTEIDIGRLMQTMSDRHVEIMRDDLSEIVYDATRENVEYIFGDSITALTEDAGGVEVAFEQGPSRRFDLVIGADGLHSNVRRLAFGPEATYSSFIGAYLAVVTMPNSLGLDGRMVLYNDVNRMAGIYGARQLDDARGVFIFRSPELEYHHRDVERQKELVREAYAGARPEVATLLEELDRTDSFYFDSVTQLRMDHWTKGRIGLVGDAGYGPGPAVGGSTSLAVVGAYVLAGEISAAADPAVGFRAYEDAIRDYVLRSRAFAIGAAKGLVAGNRASLWLVANGTKLLTKAPIRLTRALAKLNTNGVRLHDSFELKDYPLPEVRTPAS